MDIDLFQEDAIFNFDRKVNGEKFANLITHFKRINFPDTISIKYISNVKSHLFKRIDFNYMSSLNAR